MPSFFLPTTTVSVKRGEKLDSFGDPTDSGNTVAAGVPCAVSLGAAGSRSTYSQRTFAPAEGRRGVVETFTIRFRPNVVIEEQDRLIDERQGLVYLVESVFNPQSVVGAADVRVIATRVGAVSQPENG